LGAFRLPALFLSLNFLHEIHHGFRFPVRISFLR
jgi:hypothetical protein